MNKKAYISPATSVMLVENEQLLNAISDATSTNVEGVGVSETEYEGEGRSRNANVWDDEN